MQLLSVSNLPIYLPADKAPLPFGDPLSGANTITLASPGVFAVQGYDNPAVGDAISFSLPAVNPGTLPAAITVGTVYYVSAIVSAALGTFNVSATKGGASINTAQAATGNITAHLLSNQFYGVVLPFKPGNTVLLQGAAGLILQGASDVNENGSFGSFGNPGGPGAFSTLATIPASGSILVTLNADWIRVSTAATVNLIQN
jgi:hypothetical protein